MKRRKDPAKDKKRSLQERVDAWGENQKSFRKNAPRRKARGNRAFRRTVRSELLKGDEADPGAVHLKKANNWPGQVRSQRLRAQQERREREQAEPRKSEDARVRRAMRRSKSAKRPR